MSAANTAAEQYLLRAAVVEHFEHVGRGLPGERRGDVDTGGLRCAVVVRDFDPEAFLCGTLEFAVGVAPQVRSRWYGNFTKTLFYAGNPARLSARLRSDHTVAGGGIAWYGPAGPRALRDLSRMLRLFQAPHPVEAPAEVLTLVVPANAHSGRTGVLRIAVGGVSTREYLVHVNHVLCEAILRGLLRPGDAVLVCHADELTMDESFVRPDRAQLRIAEDHREPGRLRLYAGLTVGDV